MFESILVNFFNPRKQGKITMGVVLSDHFCEGLIFRAVVTAFYDSKRKRVVQKKELRLLKKMSCRGCDSKFCCQNLLDFLAEDTECLVFPEEMQHGALYKLVGIPGLDSEDVRLEFKRVFV